MRTYPRPQATLSGLCGDLNGKELKKRRAYIYIQLIRLLCSGN